MITSEVELRVSEMAENLVGSEIIKLAGEVKAKIAAGEKIANLTIGDFNPDIFPIHSIQHLKVSAIQLGKRFVQGLRCKDAHRLERDSLDLAMNLEH